MIGSGTIHRSKYSLEIDSWGDWQLEKDFPDALEARAWGQQFFSQNGWRIVNRANDEVVYVYNPTAAMAEVASHEISRFDSKDRWMSRFLEDRQRRTERLEARQRQGQMAVEEEEVAFGEGSRGITPWFHGQPANGRRRQIPTLQEAFGWDDDDDPPMERFNWIEEGF